VQQGLWMAFTTKDKVRLTPFYEIMPVVMGKPTLCKFVMMSATLPFIEVFL
jgi:hypothetical protein